MTKSYSDAYKAAGVDVTAGYKAVELMKKHVSRTTTSGVLDSIGGFGGFFMPVISGANNPPKPPMESNTPNVVVRDTCFFISSTALYPAVTSTPAAL